MIKHAELKTNFCGNAMKHPADLHNSTAKPALRFQAAMEVLLAEVTNNIRLRIFRCGAYPHIDEETRSGAFAHKAKKGNNIVRNHGFYRIDVPITCCVLSTKHFSSQERTFSVVITRLDREQPDDSGNGIRTRL